MFSNGIIATIAQPSNAKHQNPFAKHQHPCKTSIVVAIRASTQLNVFWGSLCTPRHPSLAFIYFALALAYKSVLLREGRSTEGMRGLHVTSGLQSCRTNSTYLHDSISSLGDSHAHTWIFMANGHAWKYFGVNRNMFVGEETKLTHARTHALTCHVIPD